jgi:hypothetical protein
MTDHHDKHGYLVVPHSRTLLFRVRYLTKPSEPEPELDASQATKTQTTNHPTDDNAA